MATSFNPVLIGKNSMKLFEINVQEPYYSFITDGQKTVEGRLNKGKFAEMQAGDTLKINNEVLFTVVGKRTYQTFADMIRAEGVKKVIPDKETIEEAAQVYYQFFTKEDERNYGVVAIQITPIV